MNKYGIDNRKGRKTVMVLGAAAGTVPALVILAVVGAPVLVGAPVTYAFAATFGMLSARLNANYLIEKHKKKLKLYAALKRQCVSEAERQTVLRQHFIWRSQKGGLPR